VFAHLLQRGAGLGEVGALGGKGCAVLAAIGGGA
jgi:hypothetical protein